MALGLTYKCHNPKNYHEGVPPATSHFACQTMPYRQFAHAADFAPRKVALITEQDGAFTYRELDELIRKMASGLIALDVKPGEVVAVVVGNHWSQLPLYLACGRLGAVFLVVSRYMTAAEIEFQLEEARPKLIVGDDGVSIDQLIEMATDHPVPPFNNELAPSTLRFSSGTTGKPKMMTLTHRGNASATAAFTHELGLTDDDIHFCAGPLAHAALHFTLPQFKVGGAVVMKEKFDKATFWDDCRKHNITNTMVVPTMITSALEYPGECPSLRIMLSLGAPLPPPLKLKFMERFPHVKLFDFYGATETGMLTSLRSHEQVARPTSAGLPRMGSDVGIFDDEGRPVPIGEVGTIYARGPSGSAGYIGSVRASPIPENLVRDGWRTAGDIGKLDEDGYLYLSDRRADLILSGGLNVYPAEVEAIICTIDGVMNVAVIGLPDERWGESVIAYIEGRASEEAIRAACKQQLAVYKHPRALHFVDELPRTVSGKVSRKLVRVMVADGKLPS